MKNIATIQHRVLVPCGSLQARTHMYSPSPHPVPIVSGVYACTYMYMYYMSHRGPVVSGGHARLTPYAWCLVCMCVCSHMSHRMTLVPGWTVHVRTVLIACASGAWWAITFAARCAVHAAAFIHAERVVVATQ